MSNNVGQMAGIGNSLLGGPSLFPTPVGMGLGFAGSMLAGKGGKDDPVRQEYRLGDGNVYQYRNVSNSTPNTNWVNVPEKWGSVGRSDLYQSLNKYNPSQPMAGLRNKGSMAGLGSVGLGAKANNLFSKNLVQMMGYDGFQNFKSNNPNGVYSAKLGNALNSHPVIKQQYQAPNIAYQAPNVAYQAPNVAYQAPK